ncbi:hypothetical protein EV356DRAFT_220456 [Viridothelium virens]|uniref:Uncharacterized protein n=1 Tax=Viridothelium virens TaxID=1048519 RepID=A0A6A6HLU1_VIRVR|nr:hypothetical protein EV356DRAFT_220456 [Viridothelium virens]
MLPTFASLFLFVLGAEDLTCHPILARSHEIMKLAIILILLGNCNYCCLPVLTHFGSLELWATDATQNRHFPCERAPRTPSSGIAYFVDAGQLCVGSAQ